MKKIEKTPINLSVPVDLMDAARTHFATLGKGALSLHFERSLVAYLRKRKAKLPARFLMKEGAQ